MLNYISSQKAIGHKTVFSVTYNPFPFIFPPVRLRTLDFLTPPHFPSHSSFSNRTGCQFLWILSSPLLWIWISSFEIPVGITLAPILMSSGSNTNLFSALPVFGLSCIIQPECLSEVPCPKTLLSLLPMFQHLSLMFLQVLYKYIHPEFIDLPCATSLCKLYVEQRLVFAFFGSCHLASFFGSVLFLLFLELSLFFLILAKPRSMSQSIITDFSTGSHSVLMLYSTCWHIVCTRMLVVNRKMCKNKKTSDKPSLKVVLPSCRKPI